MANTCLLVDDSRVIRKVARKILESMSFACEEAENGQLALDACKLGMPMCILLDWNMPVMNGLEFLVALRQLPEGATPKVIFCTTENDLEKIQAALTAGADEYIMKPFDGEILHDKLTQLGLL
ncbi:MAG: response regulator [Alphaproteobacteria bacterium]|nr:MAG: response regulator [Alphaproteobacteria bacterium]